MSIKSDWQHLNTYLLDLIFPKRCFGCQKLDTYLCSQCFRKIPLNHQIICPGCNLPLKFKAYPSKKLAILKHKNCQTSLRGLFVASQWQNPLIKEAVHNFKYNFIKELGPSLGQIMSQALEQNKFLTLVSQPLLVPIPLHRHRLRWRGFNQTEILARQISQKFPWPIADNFLQKEKHSRPQMTIDTIQDRWSNIKGVFSVNPALKNHFKNLSKRTILLVDDVCTTSATLEEAALCLKQSINNHLEIYGLVLARA